ncbi:hypothetical protein RBB84_12350 [Rhodococcus sp. D-6]|uniref:Uncharacterized protein n=1 Tax=Rhodococcus sp. D-6 TaxID=1387842 RepID=A0AAU7V3Q2_9NOCA
MLASGEIDRIVTPNPDRLAHELIQPEAILSVIWAYSGEGLTADRGEHLADENDDLMRTFVRQAVGGPLTLSVASSSGA